MPSTTARDVDSPPLPPSQPGRSSCAACWPRRLGRHNEKSPNGLQTDTISRSPPHSRTRAGSGSGSGNRSQSDHHDMGPTPADSGSLARASGTVSLRAQPRSDTATHRHRTQVLRPTWKDSELRAIRVERHQGDGPVMDRRIRFEGYEAITIQLSEGYIVYADTARAG